MALRFFNDSEDGVEWACREVLKQNGRMNFLKPDPIQGRHTLVSVARCLIKYQKMGLGAMVSGQLFDSPTFHEIGDRVVFQKNEVMQRQGEWSNRKLWYIIEGSASMFHTHRDGLISKTDTRYAGTIIGELGFFLDEPRYATLQVSDDSLRLNTQRERTMHD